LHELVGLIRCSLTATVCFGMGRCRSESARWKWENRCQQPQDWAIWA